MGDRLRAGIPPRYVTKPTRSTQPCIPPGSLNRVPSLIGWGKVGNVTSAGWQVTLCDPIWHVTSRSGEAVCELLYFLPLPLPLPFCHWLVKVTCHVDCQTSCNLSQLPTVPLTLTSFIDVESLLIVTGWIALQALLASVPIGYVTSGSVLADHGKLQYRCNGLY